MLPSEGLRGAKRRASTGDSRRGPPKLPPPLPVLAAPLPTDK